APDGKTLASSSDDRTVRLWDAASGKEIRQFHGHQDRIRSVVFSPDGKTLASASDDGSVRLWDAASGKEIRQFNAHQGRVMSVAYARDSKTLASAGEDRTVVGRCQRQGDPPTPGAPKGGQRGCLLSGRQDPGIGR